jgi:hypothetical protein
MLLACLQVYPFAAYRRGMCAAPQARDCGCMSALREDEQASQADGSTQAAVTGSSSEASVQVRALAADLRTRGFATSIGPGEDSLSAP